MDKIAALTKQAKKIYDAGGVPIELIGEIADYCIKLLNPLEVLPYKFPNGGKNYVVFSGNKEISRPIVKDIYISRAAAKTECNT